MSVPSNIRLREADEDHAIDIPRQGHGQRRLSDAVRHRQQRLRGAGLEVRADDQSVEIPHRLLNYLERGTRLDTTARDTGLGTYVVSGALVTDPETLAQMDIPAHEAAVLVGKVREDDAHGPAEG
jgi:hypothetical protein